MDDNLFNYQPYCRIDKYKGMFWGRKYCKKEIALIKTLDGVNLFPLISK